MRIDPKNDVSIKSMFDRVSRRYDFLNTVLSLGTHWFWKNRLVDLGSRDLAPQGIKIIDCATGTGDIADLWSQKLSPDAEIVATDFSEGMLTAAKLRHVQSKIQFLNADVQNLPFENGFFDRASISFGIRNVSDPVQALKELARVVKSSGKVMVLEFGQPTFPIFSALYNGYSNFLLPRLGGLLAGEKEAYSYLNKSSKQFPCGEKFLNLVRETGSYSKMKAYSMTGGVAWIYELTPTLKNP